MKKYLLTALLWVFGLFGFASAVSFVWVMPDDWQSIPYYTPNTITFSDDFSITSDNIQYSCSDSCAISFSDNNNICTIWYWNNELDLSDCRFSLNWTYQVLPSSSTRPFDSFTVNIPSSWWDSDSSPLLSGWTTVFSGIISSLGSAVSEFIPYVVYIWIWLLGAIIWFVAIKRLINRVRAKIFGTFNSRRRK